MQEYRLTPDELIAKDFRRIQSSHPEYQPHGKNEWLAAIKGIRRVGGSIFAGDLQRTHPFLYDQGVWIFGDWAKALRAAGVDPEKARMWRFGNKESIAKELKRMRKQSLPLNAHWVMNNRPQLFSEARRHYGSWKKTLLAEGFASIPRRTRLSLLTELSDAEQSGGNISQKLSLALAYYFGSLRKARIALKADRTFLKSWSKRKIIGVLVQRHRLKHALAFSVVRREYPSLVKAAERHFGSWGKALHAAGIDPNLYFVHHKWRNRKRGARGMLPNRRPGL